MRFLLLIVAALHTPLTLAENYSYEDSAKRHSGSALKPEQVANAKMQGECLVGLKKLNFRRQKDYDAVAEWSNFRTASLLEYYSPCEVLVIMEVAQTKVREDAEP